MILQLYEEYGTTIMVVIEAAVREAGLLYLM